ncbi:MAG: hypothetical protein GPI93_21025 [Microcystis aeruginosa LG13-12]|jgi:flagellum-specific peptidoglycan hydrolase FlgJ|nr:hypothetical protein [Microcystis aeruginosa LG13-12]
MSWQDFIKAVADADFEFEWQRPLIIAQSILESGRGTTKLSGYNNIDRFIIFFEGALYD